MKIDHRRTYYLTIDTETTNDFDDPIVYDIGCAIHDKNGKVYETRSFVIYDTFFGMADLMKTAYYAEKIPQYLEDIKNGTRKVVQYKTARHEIYTLCKKYNVKAVIAHNMAFDYNALHTTQRYLTKSKYRWFFPFGTELWDSLKMAQSTICKQKNYIRFCKENNYLTKFGRPQATAEVLYRYITNNTDFIEEHTGLADVMIEKEITAKCLAQHKKMKKLCFGA